MLNRKIIYIEMLDGTRFNVNMYRYELIFDECDKTKIKNILVGHHQGDLFENFFIRMLRGSGLKGLISLDLKGKFGEKYLLRPLLYHKKEDLIFWDYFNYS